MPNTYNNSDPLEDLEQKLNSPKQTFGLRDRKHLRPETYQTPQDWQTEHGDMQGSDLAPKSNKANWFFRFFILAFVFFLGALAFVGYKFYFQGGIDAKNVDIAINAPLTVAAGESFDFEVALQNQNQIGMRYVEVQIDFPDGTRSVEDIGTAYPNTSETIDALKIGEIVKKNYSALLFGEEGEKKEISVKLMYQIEGSTFRYKKEKKFDVVLKSTPVRLTVTNVKEITSGQELTFTVEVVSNSTQTLKDVVVEAAFPFGFNYQNSTLLPEDDKKTWIIPTLAPKESQTFTIKGTMQGQNNDSSFFKFSVGLQDPVTHAPQVVFSTKGTTVTIARPFLELDLAIREDNADTLVVANETTHTAVVSYKNNTSFPLRDATISLKIDGLSLNEGGVQVDGGFYQSLTNTITWDKTTNDQLASIPVGSSGTVSFTFNGNGVSASTFILNPELIFTVQVKGNRNPEDEVPELIENSIVKKIHFNTQLALSKKSEYYTSTFANTGPVPPSVEKKTTYTGVITLRNSSNVIKDGIVTMKIPNYIQYEGVFAPSTEKVSYDPVTRTIAWQVGNLPAKTGYTGIAPKTLSIQVGLIPSISQDGTSPTLINSIKFSGTDTFTNQNITKNTDDITTQTADAKDYYDGHVSR